MPLWIIAPSKIGYKRVGKVSMLMFSQTISSPNGDALLLAHLGGSSTSDSQLTLGVSAYLITVKLAPHLNGINPCSGSTLPYTVTGINGGP